MRANAEQYLSPDHSFPTRLIDVRDKSVWPAEDNGFRFPDPFFSSRNKTRNEADQYRHIIGKR